MIPQVCRDKASPAALWPFSTILSEQSECSRRGSAHFFHETAPRTLHFALSVSQAMSYHRYKTPFYYFQCLRYPALPAGWPQAPQSLPKHLLRRCHILDRRLRWLRTRHMALPTLHGHHDLRRPHRPTDSGKSIHVNHVLRFLAKKFHTTNGFDDSSEDSSRVSVQRNFFLWFSSSRWYFFRSYIFF